MAQITQITTLEAPGLKPYRTLRRSHDHMLEGIFVAEGSKVVQRLLKSTCSIESFLLTPEWHAQLGEIISHLPNNPVVFIGEKELLGTIVGYNLHQGVMAVARIPPPVSLDEVLQSSPGPRFLVAVDGLTNAENLGVLVRNCVAFGVQGLIVGETSSSPYLRRSVRNSMGAVFKLPVIQVEDLRQTILALRTSYKILTIAAHPHAERSVLPDATLLSDCCIVFGSEGDGISAEILDVCESIIAVPMHNEVDSLNVASASAVFLYEVYRQRIAALAQ